MTRRHLQLLAVALTAALAGACDDGPVETGHDAWAPALSSVDPIKIEAIGRDGSRALACSCLNLITGASSWVDCGEPDSCEACCDDVGGFFYAECPAGPECL